MAAVGSSIQKCYDTDLCCHIDLLGGQGSDDITVSLSSEHITSCTPVSQLLCSLSDFCLLSACQSVTAWHKEGFFSPLFCETHSFQCEIVHLRVNSKIIWMKCRSKKKKNLNYFSYKLTGTCNYYRQAFVLWFILIYGY